MDKQIAWELPAANSSQRSSEKYEIREANIIILNFHFSLHEEILSGLCKLITQ